MLIITGTKVKKIEETNRCKIGNRKTIEASPLEHRTSHLGLVKLTFSALLFLKLQFKICATVASSSHKRHVNSKQSDHYNEVIFYFGHYSTSNSDIFLIIVMVFEFKAQESLHIQEDVRIKTSCKNEKTGTNIENSSCPDFHLTKTWFT